MLIRKEDVKYGVEEEFDRGGSYERLHLLTEEELKNRGWEMRPFDEIPRIYVDDIDEYAKANGYLTQEEYNQRKRELQTISPQYPTTIDHKKNLLSSVDASWKHA